MIRRALRGLLLTMIGVGLALGIGAAALRLSGREINLGAVFDPCAPADGDWQQTVLALVRDYRDPCARFYWSPFPDGEFYNLIRLNNYGLHDSNLTLERLPGQQRVLIVGDSFPQGWQVALEQTFPSQLEQQLNAGGDRAVEVINLSVDQMGTDRELLLYSGFGWRFAPDVVLLVVYVGNDLLDNSVVLSSLHGAYLPSDRPFFTLDADGALRLHQAPPLEAGRHPDSPAWQWLAAAAAAQQPPPPLATPAAPRVISESPYQLEYPVELGLYLPETPEWAAAWALTEALIRQFRALVEAQGSRFGVVIIPDRRAVHSADWDTTVGYWPLLRGADPMAPGARLETFLQAEGIPALNLTYALNGWALAHDEAERLYYRDDGHFNAAGHEVAAQRVALWLKFAGLVPG
ncbi:MAG: hypothetical protein BroJett033_1950 [Chloroflexota bacterium]|nr:MAG: hypothetical protein BroJett033_1950 [Chloroflexota bacterium]